MNKGMFVQCYGCGYTGHISLNGSFDDREKELNRILDEGWRFAFNWKGFICPACARAGGSTDALYKITQPKPRILDKLFTYIELREQADEQLAAFLRLEDEEAAE